jgi:hypothetical protein
MLMEFKPKRVASILKNNKVICLISFYWFLMLDCIHTSCMSHTKKCYVLSHIEYTFIVQGGAEEKHVFHIRITLFILNIKTKTA